MRQNRREFLRTVSTGAASLALPSGLAACHSGGERSSGKRPNIVVIVADDMGFSDIGPYGSEIETPNLDRLAADGLRFTQFYNAARCCPTRAALLTGQYPHRTGIGHMLTDMGVPGYRGDLNSRCVTMAEVLRQSGYRTYMSGKWHLTKHVDQWTEKEQHTSKQNWPLQRGFDRFYGTITGAGSYYNPVTLTRGNTPVESVPEGYYYTDAISTQASQYVEDHARTHPGAPFFLYAAYTAPHWPLHAPSSAVDRYRGRYDEGWEPLRRQRYERMKAMGLLRDPWELSPPGRATEGWPASPVPLWNDLSPQARRWYRRAMEVYAAQVDIMDQGVGRIVDALERTGQLDNTLLLFFSDNGGCAELLREGWSGLFIPDETKEGQPVVHDNTRKDLLPGPPRTYMSYEAGWARASNTPFRLYKHWVHEGGIATPFIAHWPERFQGDGEMIRTPAHVVDLMATVVEVSGAAYPTRFQDHDIQPMQGKSLVPIFEGGSLAQRPLFWEHEGNRAVRRGRWKLVAEHDEEWRLHDLTIDRSELYDLSGQHPEKAQALATLYEAWAERTGVRSWPLAQ